MSSYVKDMQVTFDRFVLKDSEIPNCSKCFDSSNERKIVYLVPFEHETKFSELLSKLECFQEISVAVEMTSLEDAYLKIVKSETKVKDDEEIQNHAVMEMYQATEGKSNYSS